MAIETVFVLGAGASHADGAPLQKHLLTTYHRALHAPESCQDTTDAEITAFFKSFFGIDFAAAELTRPLPTFEDVLGIIEIALKRGESFPDFDLAPQNPRLQRMREHLVALIANMLAYVGTADSYHQKLVNSLHKEGSLLRTAFISLNYDAFIALVPSADTNS